MVSLSFDDALDCHLDLAIPTLETSGLRGTFYVDLARSSFFPRLREWKAASARGHELGNHTVFHPGVSSKAWVTEALALENYSLDRMERELTFANQVLESVDGKSRRTFAFPCSNPWLGHVGWARRLLTRLGMERTRVMGWIDRNSMDVGSRLVDYTPLVRSLFPAARCGGVDPGMLTRTPSDRHRIRAVAGDGMTLAQLSEALELAVSRGAWLVLVFHGVDGGHHLSCERTVLAEFAARLAQDKRVEVLTVLEASDRIWKSSAP